MKISKLLRFLLSAVLPMYIGENEDAVGSDDNSGLSGADTVGTGNADRLALLDRINDANDRERAEEFRNVNDDDTTSEFVAPVDPDADETDPNSDPVVVDEVITPKVDEPTPAVTKIKVNGEEVELTPDLITKAQKIASADKYLEDAAKARKEATATPEKDPPKLPSPEDVAAARAEEDLALVRAIQVGTEEEAVAALRKIRSEQRSPAITVDEIGRIAEERLNFKTALSWFEDEYKDLVGDPELHLMVLREDDKLVKAGDDRSYKDRYKAIGDGVRKWRDGLVAKLAPAPAAPEVTTKEARKATAPKVPTAANTKAKPEGDDEQDESPASVIAAMAKSRGGPQWAR